jgi:hypothetical protein
MLVCIGWEKGSGTLRNRGDVPTKQEPHRQTSNPLLCDSIRTAELMKEE